MKKHLKHPVKSSERGSSLVEGIAAILILILILFGMLQVYNWCMTRQYCQYSAFYASKSLSLGYRPVFSLRSARVAAIPISGTYHGSGNDDEDDAEAYMVDGDGSGVRYAYWHNSSSRNQPVVELSGNYKNDDVHARVKLLNAPLLNDAIGKLFFISGNPEPAATVYSRNYSKTLLEE